MSEPLPMNRGNAWMLLLLWLLPSSYAVLAYAWKGKLSTRLESWFGVVPRDYAVLYTGVFFAALIGCIWARLKARGGDARNENGWSEMAFSLVWFLMMQTLLVPLALATAAFAACSASFFLH